MSDTATSFRANGRDVSVQASRDTPRVYALRNGLHLKATRFGSKAWAPR